MKRNSFFLICLVCAFNVLAQQTAVVHGRIIAHTSGKSIEGALVSIRKLNKQVTTEKNGKYRISGIPYGLYEIEFFADGLQKQTQQITVNQSHISLDVKLEPLSGKLQEVKITSDKKEGNGIKRMNSVEGFGIYESKKSEVIILKDMSANLATNNARQIFGKVPGLNIWESDQAGLQLGVGGRGLSPNRTSNFNTRQNGYDISADALGYPESYYTPPVEALERIEVVRGAASLQYGTQFGGMLNFGFKKGPSDKKLEVVSRQTFGSFGFFGSFNSLGGTVGKGRLNYYTFFNHKQGDGWRPNSGFEVNTVYGSVRYDVTEKLALNADYTFMSYNAQQPGGMTDAQFAGDPRRSFRNRNWFKVNWNLFALTADYRFTPFTKLNIRNFGLVSQRFALGNLERINVADLGGPRTLIRGDFANIGNETRLLHQYRLWSRDHTLLVGGRFYYGTNQSIQGDASSGSDAEYALTNPEDPEGSDYTFSNQNIAAFAENIFRISKKITITPGVRFEYINTASDGHYKLLTKDFAGNVIVDSNIYGNEQHARSFFIGGIGMSFKLNQYVECYGNISQNYRAVNFNDIRIVNPNSKVDPNMKDESGYSADAGVRGNYRDFLNYDITVFLVSYNNRIGQTLKADQPPLYQDYRYRTNIADSRNLGIECFSEADMWRVVARKESKNSLLLFANIAFVDARYIDAADKAIENNKVEMAPPLMMRGGITYKRAGFRSTLQGSYVTEHYTDATNAVRVAGAVNGIIPTYRVMDFSTGYTYKWVTIEASCNNLLNAMYYTRRADSYPGPGIIPSDGRSFYLTLAVKI
ncbi:MAG: TonB-dependent receptor [Bacteroidota bacterium]